MNKKLFIWDVDGTLIKSQGVGKKALEDAFEIMTGIKDSCKDIRLGGKTDTLILYEMCELFNVDKSIYEEYFETYCRMLKDIVKGDCSIRTVPNIPYILEIIKEKGGFNILGTGNIENGARLKLLPADLNKHFDTGGFGDREPERWKIIKNGIERAESFYSLNFEKEDIYVIGDTPRDIECARTVGVKSIAVATGYYSRDELEKYDADFLFEDLSSTGSVLEAVGL